MRAALCALRVEKIREKAPPMKYIVVRDSQGIDFPVFWFTTLTTLPRGRVLWAAVIALGFIRSPLAVFCPGKEYQDAPPH